jgi:hypothetical protein
MSVATAALFHLLSCAPDDPGRSYLVRRTLPVNRKVLALTVLFGCFLVVSGFGLDVSVTIPTVEPLGPLKTAAQDAGIDFSQEIAGPLQDLADELQANINDDPDIQRFTSLNKLATGFANAGAASSHLGTPRAFSDYRAFALVLGTGVAAAAPGIDPATIQDAGEKVENEGDVYVGGAVQPVTVGLGVNLDRWLSKTRAYVKVGYFDLPFGTVADEVAFNSLSIGVGASYQVIETRQLPLGFLRWRGVSLSSGILFQRNQTDVKVDVSNEAFAPNSDVLYQDVLGTGFNYSPYPFDGTDPIGSIEVEPTLTAAIESRTYSVPLEASTGLRILWLLDLNLGAGIDVVFGSSDLEFGANADAKFVPDPSAADYIETQPGNANFNISASEGPQFARPRVTGGMGLNLGPVKLDVPLMLYFDSEGNTLMGGVNVAIVW